MLYTQNRIHLDVNEQLHDVINLIKSNKLLIILSYLMDFNMKEYYNIRDNKLRHMHSHNSNTQDGNMSHHHIFQ